MTPFQPRKVAPARLSALSVVLPFLLVALGCAPSPDPGLPPIHRDPAKTLLQHLDQPGTIEAATMTRWWMPDAKDPLEEVRRLARDLDSDLPSLRELFADGVPLSESDVVELVLAANLDIRISDKDRRAAVANVMARRGQVYDTVFNASYADTDREVPVADSDGSSSSSSSSAAALLGGASTGVSRPEGRSGRVGLAQNVFTGGRVELFYTESEAWDGNSEANERERDGEAALSLTQPLLRGFGPTVTNAPITSARIQQEISEEDLRSALATQLSTALTTYYDLIFAFENAAVQRISLQQALDLLEINISRERVGDLAIVDVEQARANAAARKEQYLIAVQRIYDTQDILRRLLNIDRAEGLGWSVPILPSDLPAYAEVTYTEDQQLRVAFANRPDWRRTAGTIALAELNESVARNALLPSLNLTGKVGQLGTGEGGGDTRDQVGEGDFDEYEVALELSYPLLNREARYDMQRRRLEVEKARYQRDALALAIRTEIRTRLRALRTNRLRVDVTLEAVRAEQVKYDAELKRYEVGLSTSFQLLQFLEDLANAKVSHLQAIIDYQKSRVDLASSCGTLTTELGLVVEADTISRSGTYVAPGQAPGAPYRPVEGGGELPHVEVDGMTGEVVPPAPVTPDAVGVEAEELPEGVEPGAAPTDAPSADAAGGAGGVGAVAPGGSAAASDPAAAAVPAVGSGEASDAAAAPAGGE